jgi:DNA-binding NarL/FixJ family response regulator
MSEAVRVLVVDSPALVRECLATLLRRKPQIEVVGDAGTGRDALEQARSATPDVVLVDPAVPDGGPSLVADLCSEVPAAGVVVLTSRTGDGSVARMLQQGVRGYLEKSCDLAAVAQCIKRVHAGEVVIARTLSESLPKDFETFRHGHSAALTPREREVLGLVADGLTNGEIARQLCITEHTVKSHLGKILGKLGVDNRVQLATYATEQHILGRAKPAGA